MSDQKRVLEIRVSGKVLPAGAKDPAGHVSAEARFLDAEAIRALGDNNMKLAEWNTPLCPWTRRVLAERLERLANAIGDRDPLVVQACVLASNLIQHGTLLPPGVSISYADGKVPDRGPLDQFRILREEDVHGHREEEERAGPPESGPVPA